MAENNRRSSRGELRFSKSTRVSGVLGDFGQLLNGVSERYQRQASLFRGIADCGENEEITQEESSACRRGFDIEETDIEIG